ncbi:MAG: catalase [Arachidicoccus sp.]|nr:catalase [Arachidicoccus sp.]
MAKKSSKPATSSLQNASQQTKKTTQLDELITDNDNTALTTNQGLKINDNQNSLKAGERGATLLEDFILREKITHFDHERIPERIVHARGSAAHGYFQVYKNLEQYTAAKFLTDTSAKTPVFVRFSTVAGERGSTDLARDARGFAVKFYTDEGNFDLVGNNIPVFFIQDAIKFPDLVHSVKPEPHHGMPQAASAHDTFWDFISLMPESMHMVLWVMSDRGIPRSLRMMEGFGIHTFRLVNKEGKAHFVKFHWKPLLGVHSVAWDEATKISGKDSDFHRRDLWEAIESGAYPEWELGLQIIPEEDEYKFDFDLLDPTKLIPEELVPVQIVGKMTLNRNPDNFFAETEQVAFHPGHVVPGIDFSNDPLLQGRLFSYTDTQLSRLGSANFHELPINRPINTVHNNQRDGHMRHQIVKGQVSYEPNTLGGGCPYQSMWKDGGFVSFNERVDGQKIRARSKSFVDHYSQAKLFFNSQSEPEKKHITNAIIFELSKVQTSSIRERVVSLLNYVDKELAKNVGKKLGVAPAKLEQPNQSIPADADAASLQSKEKNPNPATSAALSMANTVKNTIKTRKIAFMLDNGVDAKIANALKAKLEKEGGVVEIVATSMAPVTADDQSVFTPQHSLTSTASVCFDALYIAAGKKSVENLLTMPESIEFVNEAYKHCKAIAFGKDTQSLFDKTNIAAKKHDDPAVIQETDKDYADKFIKAITNHRVWELEDARNNPA